MTLVAPSLLSADFAHLARDVERVCQDGADLLHVDIMDGHFVPNLTIGPMVVQAIKPYATVPLDVHLMMDHPESYLDVFIKAGANQLTLHAELDINLKAALKHIRSRGVRAGLSLKPHTPASILQTYKDDIDLILVMTVEPGFGGQVFDPTQLPKMNQIRMMMEDRPVLIQVDGGINPETGRLCVAHGADVLVAGSYIFNSPDWAQAIRLLKESA